VPVWIHLSVLAAAGWGLMIATLRWIPREAKVIPPQRHRRERAAGEVPAWRDPSLMAIGFVILAVAMSEGAANDWLPLIFADGFHLDQALGSVRYSLFAAAMTIGRFSGGLVPHSVFSCHISRRQSSS
jgi:hypothetical protein